MKAKENVNTVQKENTGRIKYFQLFKFVWYRDSKLKPNNQDTTTYQEKGKKKKNIILFIYKW